MVRVRRLLAASGGALALAFVIALPALAADPTGPIGTLTINDGSGYASTSTLTLLGTVGRPTVDVDGFAVLR